RDTYKSSSQVEEQGGSSILDEVSLSREGPQSTTRTTDGSWMAESRKHSMATREFHRSSSINEQQASPPSA
ncbi:unnamed protein product, partial [Amoebophrya sp. A25]